MCAKKSKAVKSRMKAARKIKKQEQAIERREESDRQYKILREHQDNQPPNNPYGMHNVTYSRYRPLVEKFYREKAQRETRLIDFEQFRRHRTFPENLHESAINAAKPIPFV